MRKVLTIAAALVVIAAGALVFVVLPSDDDEQDGRERANGLNAVTATRTYSGTSNVLEIGGVLVAKVSVVAAGGPFGEVVENDLGGGQRDKYIGTVRQSDIVVEMNVSEASAMQSWMAESWTGGGAVRSGSLTSFDFNGNPTTQTQFSNATLSSVLVPGVDSAVSGPATLRIAITPESASVTKGSGSAKTLAAKTASATNAFRFELAGLPTTKISKVEPFEITSKVDEVSIGETREPTKSPARVTIPNLRVVVGSADAGPWKTWVNDFLVNGNTTSANERAGALTYLDQTLTKTLARVDLTGCGPVRATAVAASGDALPNLAVDLYCEGMATDFPTATP
jgi:hypothetical protein